MAKIKTAGSGNLRSSKLIIIGVVILTLAVFAGALTMLSNLYSTTTYYVLNMSVSPRTQITPDMLTAVPISSEGVPATALDISQFQASPVFAKYSLDEGDILTSSNVAYDFGGISEGIPDSWVVTNFSVNADSAVGGRIRKGDYFDFMVVTEEGAFYPFVNVLVLDATVSLDTASSSEAAETAEAYAGQTSQYFVGMPPAEAAELQQLMKLHADGIRLVISPNANDYRQPALEDYSGLFVYEAGETKNLGAETDNSFPVIERDKCTNIPVDPALSEAVPGETGNFKPLSNCGEGQTPPEGEQPNPEPTNS